MAGFGRCTSMSWKKVCIHVDTVPVLPPESRYRFFETEGLAILTMLVSRYEIVVKEEPQFAHESFEERKTRLLASKFGITSTYVYEFRTTLDRVLM
jgi:hypothetical protein